MALGVLTLVCVAVFVVCAFALRARMKHLRNTCELRMRMLREIELDVAELEREIAGAAANAAVMERQKLLFRGLWPEEYDGALYAARHFIAQSTSAVAVASR